jgi:hypothetical protein
MKRLTTALVAFALFCGSRLSHAVDDEFQAWSALSTNGPVNNGDLLFWFDGHARFGDDAGRLSTSIIRPGLGWRYSSDLTLWLGYARVTGHQANPNIEEDRIWQQAIYRLSDFGSGQLSGRTRLEQRFREEDSDKGMRLRQFLRWTKPIQNTSLSYVIANELFLNLNDADWGQSSGFNQNRMFLGMNHKISETYKVEVGYVNNYINQIGRGNQLNHILSASLSVTW